MSTCWYDPRQIEHRTLRVVSMHRFKHCLWMNAIEPRQLHGLINDSLPFSFSRQMRHSRSTTVGISDKVLLSLAALVSLFRSVVDFRSQCFRLFDEPDFGSAVPLSIAVSIWIYPINQIKEKDVFLFEQQQKQQQLLCLHRLNPFQLRFHKNCVQTRLLKISDFFH